MTEFVLVILLFAVAAGALGVGMVGVGWLLGPKRSGRVKEMPYESGMDPIHDARRRFDVRFHLVAIAFLVFDVELLFLYPWAVAARHTAPAAEPRSSARTVTRALLESSTKASAAKRETVRELEGRELETDDSESQAGEIAPERVASPMLFADQQVDRRLIFGGVMFFLGLVILGLVYEWKKGILQWR